MEIELPCNWDQACPEGPLTLRLSRLLGGGGIGTGSGFTSGTDNPIQPCDTVTWKFGDGTTATVVGSDSVTHNYAPGNYDIHATVTNALGSGEALVSRAVASSPSQLAFVTGDVAVPWGTCPCVVASERDGSVTLKVRRTLDLSRTVSAVATVARTREPVDGPGVSGYSTTLTFAPGETEKSFSIPIADDARFYGPRFFTLELTQPTGGTLIDLRRLWRLLVLDNELPPTMSFRRREIAILEGTGGKTVLTMPVYLSEPMQNTIYRGVWLRTGTAWETDFERYQSAFMIPAGATSGDFVNAITADALPEPDETFIVQLRSQGYANDPIIDDAEVVVTIVNDDAAFLPNPLVTTAGVTAILKLDIGSPYKTPTTVVFTSSNEAAVPAPKPITIPAGVTKVSIPITGRSAGAALIRTSVPARTTPAAIVTVTAPPPAPPPPKRRSARH